VVNPDHILLDAPGIINVDFDTLNNNVDEINSNTPENNEPNEIYTDSSDNNKTDEKILIIQIVIIKQFQYQLLQI